MRQNTAFYRNDFEIDKEIISRAAASDKAEDKTLLWMSRPSGTYCFRESDVYLQGTRQHNTWKFYGEQTRDRVLAYAVELTGKVRGVIRGNLYELDYPQHFRHVAAEAVQADNIILHYEKGDREQPAGLYFDGRPDPRHDFSRGAADRGRTERPVRPQQPQQDAFHGGAVPILRADCVQQGHRPAVFHAAL